MASWTPAQSKAIETRNKNLLISAAAGSGKTAVLIERIIRLITDHSERLDISRMLIVTFTRAAASELKQRISKAISKEIANDPSNTRLFSQLTAIGSAHISTIDSFYADIVKKYSSRLGIPSTLRIADDSELNPIRKRIMNEVLDMGYSGAFDISQDESNGSIPYYKDATHFTAFADSISDMRNDSRTWETLIDLRAKLLSHLRFTEFLKDCEDEYSMAVSCDLFSTPHGHVLREHLVSKFEVMVSFLSEACDYLSNDPNMAKQYLGAFKHDLEFCENFLDVLNSGTYTDAREEILLYTNEKLGRLSADQKTELCSKFASFRSDFVVDAIKDYRSKYFSGGCSEAELIDYATRLAIICNIMHAVLSKFEELYSEEKLSMGICEFSDVKQWAYKLLVAEDGSPTEIAREVSECFDAVYIDEYQDVDPVQDLIFRAISRPRSRFMVGDVKQSIYGFRGADPSLFMNYRLKFTSVDVESDSLPEDDDCTIFMSSNFRCDENVIKFANSVCSYLFTLADGGIKYTPEDNLEFAKNRIEGYTPPAEAAPVRVTLIEQAARKSRGADRDDSDGEGLNREAEYIAAEISRLLASGKKNNGDPINEKDIAVFSRSEKFLGKVAKALDFLRIKHSGGKGENIFDDPEVMIALSLLHAVDNPRKDSYLAGVLMSPIFGFSADELILLRAEGKNGCLYDAICQYSEQKTDRTAKKCALVIESLDELRNAAVSLPADKIVRLIYSKFALLSRNEEGGNSKSALLKLYDNARSYEGDEFKGLYSYLLYVEDMIENNKAPSVSLSCEDSVQLMTIHKSKGLEFPVCFVASTGSRFNRDDIKKPLVYSPTLGVSADIIDGDGFGKLKTPYQSALGINIANTATEEEIRLLYVALTRARERLYVTATVSKNLESTVDFYSSYSSRGTVMSGNGYIPWILSALKVSKKHDFYEIEKISAINDAEDSDSETATEEATVKEEVKIEYTPETAELVRRNFEFEYPYLHVSNLPAKLSVSKLTPNILDRSTELGEDEGDLGTLDVSLPEIYTAPTFMSDGNSKNDFSAAEKGTATHNFLQFCDFAEVKRGGVESELERLVRDRFIDPRWVDAVNVKQLECFFKSSLFDEISKARRVWREQRFNILLPAAAFTEDAEYGRLIKDERLLVQGVIDIFFENDKGELILCDYKTDFLTAEERNDPSLARKKLNDAHARQLSYYSEALKTMFGRYPTKVLVYSLPLGDTVEIDTIAIPTA